MPLHLLNGSSNKKSADRHHLQLRQAWAPPLQALVFLLQHQDAPDKDQFRVHGLYMGVSCVFRRQESHSEHALEHYQPIVVRFLTGYVG